MIRQVERVLGGVIGVGVSGFARYLGSLQSRGLADAPTHDEAWKDYLNAQRHRWYRHPASRRRPTLVRIEEKAGSQIAIRLFVARGAANKRLRAREQT